MSLQFGTLETRRGLIFLVSSTLLTWVTVSSLPAAGATASPAVPQKTLAIEFDIPRAPLAEALLIFARQADLSVVMADAATAMEPAPAVSGSLLPEKALAKLLAGSGYGYRYVGETTIAVFPIPVKPEPASETAVAETVLTEKKLEPIEEVIVTALHQQENLQKVPVAVSVISGATLKEGRIDDLESVSTRVPGLTVTSFSLGQPSIHMRGIGSNDDGAAMDNSVVLFVDDVYVGRISAIDMGLADLERVEVLRGPQGTFYGRNAIGGAIRLLSRQPAPESSGDLGVSLGNLNHRGINGMINGPLAGDSWSGRLFAEGSKRDGWQRNLVTPGDRQHDDNRWQTRGQLRFNPESALDMIWSLDISRENLGSTGRIPVRGGQPIRVLDSEGQPIPLDDGSGGFQTALPTDLFARLNGDPQHATNGVRGYTDREIGGISQRLWNKFMGLDFLSVTAYRDSHFRWLEDSIGLPTFVTDQTVNSRVDERHRQFSQEFRWSSDPERTYSYILGLYYLREHTERVEDFPFRSVVATTDQDNTTRSYALYASANWQPAPRWTLSLGGRYTRDRKSLDQQSTSGGAPSIILEDFQLSTRADWEDFSPRLSLGYQMDDMLLYGTVAKGMKSGGFQGAPGTREIARRVIEPEIAWDYELGIKSQWLEDRLITNATAFYIDYRDLQVVQFSTLDNFGLFETSNAASASVRGLELETVLHTGMGFDITASYAFLRATYDSFHDFQDRDFTGSSLRQAPRHSFHFGIGYHRPFAGGELRLTADYRYQSESFREPDNSITRQPGYQLTDASIRYTAPGGKWELSLWGRNLADEEYIAHLYILGGNDYALYGTPRTFGIGFTWRHR